MYTTSGTLTFKNFDDSEEFEQFLTEVQDNPKATNIVSDEGLFIITLDYDSEG